MFTTYLQNKIKNRFLQKNYLGVLKLSKQKKFWNFEIFFLYSVQDAPCDSRRKFHAGVGGYSGTAKNRQKLVYYSYALSSKG
jgi:hypothetical protein